MCGVKLWNFETEILVLLDLQDLSFSNALWTKVD